ncbi:unnamed protein product [Candidula unifasciata]|uniref:Uncharacterized protein n=1 Tax=Candidula unifasciata TaxID=100452 RepID=A0A8S3YK63_9EUPU|nr:unnamed protein product [Candidula unifasciata]
MHDHDPRGTNFSVRTSPPQVCDFLTNTQCFSKQQQPQQQQQCQQQQQPQQQQQCQQQSHNQMQQQQYLQNYHHPQQQQHHHLQQHQLQQHPLSQYPQQHLNVGYDSQSTFSCSTFTTASPNIAKEVCHVDDFEDVDEDQISDLDEEEELRLSYEHYRQNFHRQPDVTSQLLQFADMVSADIKKFFGRTKDQDDSCDVYADKWATVKSGRELYYADLLRIAQGESETTTKSTRKSLSSLSSTSSSSLSPHQDLDTRSQFSGRRDDSIGVGPLSELFEYKFPSLMYSNREHQATPSSSISKRNPQSFHRSHKSTVRVVPMHERKLPESFWREPCARRNQLTCSYSNRLDASQNNLLSSSKLPDFSDLVESWQGGNYNMTSRDINKTDSRHRPVEQQRL